MNYTTNTQRYAIYIAQLMTIYMCAVDILTNLLTDSTVADATLKTTYSESEISIFDFPGDFQINNNKNYCPSLPLACIQISFVTNVRS